MKAIKEALVKISIIVSMLLKFLFTLKDRGEDILLLARLS